MSYENWPPPPPRQRKLWSGDEGEAPPPPPAPPAASPPPPPPPPQRRDHFPLIAGLLGLLAVGATVGAIASTGGDDDSPPIATSIQPRTTTVPTTPTLPTTPTTPSTSTPSPPLNPRHIVHRSTVGAGIPVADDGVLFRVQRLRQVGSIPHTHFTGPIVATRTRRLIRADIVYVNRTGHPIDVFCGGYGATLLDSAKHHRRPLHNYLDIKGNDDVCSNKIQPGGSSHVTFAFLIPRGAQARGLFVYNAKANDFDGADTKLFFAKP